MSNANVPTAPLTPTMTDSLKNWMMVILTLVFVLLYAGALIGWIVTLDAIKNLQPIVFVIIGYYFGRLPAQQNENSLKEEIKRQSNKADAVANAKEKAQQEREALEEKVKNVRAALTTSNDLTLEGANIGANNSLVKADVVAAVNTALKILNS